MVCQVFFGFLQNCTRDCIKLQTHKITAAFGARKSIPMAAQMHATMRPQRAVAEEDGRALRALVRRAMTADLRRIIKFTRKSIKSTHHLQFIKTLIIAHKMSVEMRECFIAFRARLTLVDAGTGQRHNGHMR